MMFLLHRRKENPMKKIGILGCGWGTALAIHSFSCGHAVTLWSPFENEINSIKKNRQSPVLAGVLIPDDIFLTSDISDIADADIIIFATPSFAIRETAMLLAGKIGKKTILVNAAKGMEKNTYLRLSQVINQELPDNPVVVLSGPSHAEEVARGVPTLLVAAGTDKAAAHTIQTALMNEALRIYTSPDITGVEISGALKNIIALAGGIVDGLSLGDNTKAALITRGLIEISRLGVIMGGKQETFYGLAGIGDLIVTCMSVHSRNHRCGVLLGQGMPLEYAEKQIGMTVEGVFAAEIAYNLSKKYKISNPLIDSCYDLLYNGKSVKTMMQKLMTREIRDETEQAWVENA